MTRELGQSQEEQRGLELEKWGSQPSLAPCWSWLRGGGDATGEEEALDQKGCSQPALTRRAVLSQPLPSGCHGPAVCGRLWSG